MPVHRCCTLYVCAHICAGAGTCAHICRGQRSSSGVVLGCHPTFLMKQCLVGPEIDKSARLSGQQARELPVSIPLVLERKSMPLHLALLLGF